MTFDRLIALAMFLIFIGCLVAYHFTEKQSYLLFAIINQIGAFDANRKATK